MAAQRTATKHGHNDPPEEMIPSTKRHRRRKGLQSLFLYSRCSAIALLVPTFVLTARSILLSFSVLSKELGIGKEKIHLVSNPRQKTNYAGKQDQEHNSSNCFLHNSLEWRTQPRLGNANDTTMDGSFARRMVLSIKSLSGTRSLLSRSICHTQSHLVSMIGIKDIDDETRRRYWQTRLVYLAIHYHQHQPAMAEVQTRSQPQCAVQEHKHAIGSFDFECPRAKFLVVRLFSNGIGANMRLGAVPAFIAGLVTNRVVLFVNHAPVGPSFLQNPWTSVSCPRGDMQCFFLPSSPCVVTHKEIQRAQVLTKSDVRLIFRNGTLQEDKDNERVLILRLAFRPQREPDNLRRRLYEKARPVALSLVHNLNLQDKSAVLDALEDLLQPDLPSMDSYNYYGANSPLFHALLLYAMRPNPRAEIAMQAMVKQALPSSYQPDQSIGLAIRATDKCDVESECLSLPQYLRSLKPLWNENGIKTNIVITTEARDVMHELKSMIQKNVTHLHIPFDAQFVTNRRDVLQDSGYLYKQQSAYTQQDAMLSAISSLQLQMATRLTVGNCCSNFHLLLADFLSEGCGMAARNTFVCLQDHPISEFRMCCQWDKSEECLARRNGTLLTIAE